MASLNGAYLQQTNLKQANLEGADLVNANNLTIQQLSTVQSLYKCQIDFTLLDLVHEYCPNLLINPKAISKLYTYNHSLL